MNTPSQITMRRNKENNILIVKTSSLGDIIHFFPAINDLKNHNPKLQVDWAIEKEFSEVLAWNTDINNIIPISVRKWRKHFYKASTWIEIKKLIERLREKNYSFTIDAQGLLKSLIISKMTHSNIWGFDRKCNRESITSLFYDHECHIAESFFQVHAIERNRRLLAHIFDYEYQPEVYYGNLIIPENKITHPPEKYIIFIHGTSRIEKEWPETKWIELAHKLISSGYDILLPWNTLREHSRARNIQSKVEQCIVLPKMTLSEISSIIQRAKAVIGVDTGLMHIAASLKVPGIALFGETDSNLFCPIGEGDTVTTPKLISPIQIDHSEQLIDVDSTYKDIINKLHKCL